MHNSVLLILSVYVRTPEHKCMFAAVKSKYKTLSLQLWCYGVWVVCTLKSKGFLIISNVVSLVNQFLWSWSYESCTHVERLRDNVSGHISAECMWSRRLSSRLFSINHFKLPLCIVFIGKIDLPYFTHWLRPFTSLTYLTCVSQS